MEPKLNDEILYEEYREGNLDSLPSVEVTYELRVLVDGEEIFNHEYRDETLMEEDAYKREFAIQSYRKALLAERYEED